ncbi:hypothetical protein [Streptomyces sp. NPDC000405]|uniref:hypothetical protein n=1 Tax=Streptomyces sp. NPDC000405 TaxID=3161033 RepID=UPI00398D66D3
MFILATGCGSDSAAPSRGTEGSGSSARAEAPRISYDPPRTFSESAVSLPKEAGFGKSGGDMWGSRLVGSPPVTLRGTQAYVASPYDLQIVDTGNGRVTTIRPEHDSPRSAQVGPSEEIAGPPLVSDTGVGVLVIVPFAVRIPGSGTTPDSHVLEMAAVDTDSAAVKWRAVLQLPKWTSKAYGNIGVRMVGSQADVAVVRVSNYENETAVAVNLRTHRVLWQKDFLPTAVLGTTVSGLERNLSETHLKAFDLATGEPTWAIEEGSYNATASSAGPNLLQYSGQIYENGKFFARFLDAHTGKVINEIQGVKDVTCAYDGKSVTVCSGGASHSECAFAVDAQTGKLLWQLPDRAANRIAPEITAAWNGRAYGTTVNGPIALDARTGADVKVSPGMAPVLVNGYTGLTVKGRTVTAHRTTS